MNDLKQFIIPYVILQVEKKLLEPPKPNKHEKSPPPKKLSSAKTNAGVGVLKKSHTASTNQAFIAKSKSTNDMPKKKESDIKVMAPAKPQPPPPPVNLLKTHRPPLEIHRIEGDKIIIIRRIPRNQRPPQCVEHVKHKSLPSLPEATANQVIIVCGRDNPFHSFHFMQLLIIIEPPFKNTKQTNKQFVRLISACFLLLILTPICIHHRFHCNWKVVFSVPLFIRCNVFF